MKALLLTPKPGWAVGVWIVALCLSHYTNAGEAPTQNRSRQAIAAKLDQITFDSVPFENWSLKDVAEYLHDRTRANDPEKKGMNFLISQAKPLALRPEIIESSGKIPSRTIQRLEECLAEQEAKITQAQAKVTKLKARYGITDTLADDHQSGPQNPETVRRFLSSRIEVLSAWSQMNAMYQKLKNLNREDLRKAMPTAFPDTLLTDLLSRYAQTEQELTTQRRDLSNAHPNVERLNLLLSKINQQIEEKLEGMLVGLEARIKGLKTELDTRDAEFAKAKDNDIKMAKEYGEYFLAKREVEFQQQIYREMALKLAQMKMEACFAESAQTDPLAF